jgi:hypothetical protein
MQSSCNSGHTVGHHCLMRNLWVSSQWAAAINTSTSLLEGLVPLHFLDYMGAIHNTNMDKLPDGLRQVMHDSSQKEGASEDAEDLKMSHWFSTTFKKVWRILQEGQERHHEGEQGSTFHAQNCIGSNWQTLHFGLISPGVDCHGNGHQQRVPRWGKRSGPTHPVDWHGPGLRDWPWKMARLYCVLCAVQLCGQFGGLAGQSTESNGIWNGHQCVGIGIATHDGGAYLDLCARFNSWLSIPKKKMEIAQTLYDDGILSILQMQKPDKSVQLQIKVYN